MTRSIYVDSVIPGVCTLGPGVRIGLWVQGCTLACAGCIAPSLFKRRDESRIDGDVLLNIILALSPAHDGLTLAGGEPFQQARSLAPILETVRAKTPLNILIYSGYRLAEIQRRGKSADRLLACADAIIDGRYRQAEPPLQPWAGSGNQQLHVLTDRLPDVALTWRVGMQSHLSSTGQLRLLGIPRPEHKSDFPQLVANKLILRKERQPNVCGSERLP